MNTNSLKSSIIYRLIIPVILLILIEFILSFYVALHFVEKTYDRWLLDSASSLMQEIKVDKGEVFIQLSNNVLEIFKWDEMDTTFFNINAEKKGLLAGNFILPLPMTADDWSQPIFSNISIEKQVVRMVSLQVTGNLPEKVYIHVAETLNKRKQVMLEILVAELVPRILLTLLISIFLYRAVNRGLT